MGRDVSHSAQILLEKDIIHQCIYVQNRQFLINDLSGTANYWDLTKLFERIASTKRLRPNTTLDPCHGSMVPHSNVFSTF